MSRYNDGEYMPLIWDGQPDVFYIKGHVNTEDGWAILVEEEVVLDRKIGQAVQCYGRWSTEPGDDNWRHVLREYKNPGRGRFKITAFGVGIFAKQPLLQITEQALKGGK